MKHFTKYHRSILNAMAKVDDELIDHVWSLFENQDNLETPGLIEACMFFSSMWDFDIEVLPPKLYDAVADRIKQEAEERYWEDRAQDVMDQEQSQCLYRAELG